MASYDKEKDKTLKEYKPIDIGNEKSIVVKIMKYAEGQPKISILKSFKTKDDEERFTSKIGRIDYETMVALIDTLKKATEDIHEY